MATHDRRGTDVRSTLALHLPEHRGELRRRSRTFREGRAEQMGDEVRAFIREVFDAVGAVEAILALPRAPGTLTEGLRE